MIELVVSINHSMIKRVIKGIELNVDKGKS